MKIERPDRLDLFRTPGLCECCGRFANIREPHHLRAKGMGGTPLDVAVNLIALGGSAKLTEGRRSFSCECHYRIHAGNISPDRILQIVAAREGVTAEHITEVMDWMQRLIKPTESQLRRALEELSPPALAIAALELIEAGMLTPDHA